MNINIQDLRQTYTKGELLEYDLPSDPFILFNDWFDEMNKKGGTLFDKLKYKISSLLIGDNIESNARCISTITDDNHPNSRMVLMKGIGSDHIEFFTNYESDKANEIDNNKYITAVFWWSPLQRQVIFRGVAERVSDDINNSYFQTRPLESKLGAIASAQSQIISNRDVLEETYFKVKEKYKDSTYIDKPDHWGGYKIIPSQVEFWQGRVGRLHDRLRFTKNNDTWKIVRLSP